jgi:hypothetical protein
MDYGYGPRTDQVGCDFRKKLGRKQFEMSQNGPKWPKMVLSILKWIEIGPKLSEIGRNGPKQQEIIAVSKTFRHLKALCLIIEFTLKF